MAAHSSVLARRIPWTTDPGGLQSMGPQRVGLSDYHSFTCLTQLLYVCLPVCVPVCGENIQDLLVFEERNTVLSPIVTVYTLDLQDLFIHSISKLKFWTC